MYCPAGVSCSTQKLSFYLSNSLSAHIKGKISEQFGIPLPSSGQWPRHDGLHQNPPILTESLLGLQLHSRWRFLEPNIHPSWLSFQAENRMLIALVLMTTNSATSGEAATIMWQMDFYFMLTLSQTAFFWKWFLYTDNWKGEWNDFM